MVDMVELAAGEPDRRANSPWRHRRLTALAVARIRDKTPVKQIKSCDRLADIGGGSWLQFGILQAIETSGGYFDARPVDSDIGISGFAAGVVRRGAVPLTAQDDATETQATETGPAENLPSEEEPNPAVSEIEAAIQAYVAAFNARDAQSLANLWAPEAVYTSRSSGEQIVGRDAMVADFTSIFAGDNPPNLAVATESIEFISPNVGLQRGTATLTYSEDDVAETRYSVVYVKRDGAWLIDRVTEDEIVVAVSNREKLEPLEWLIGEWVDDPDSTGVELDCQWTRNQNFISVVYKVFDDEGEIASSGLQVIGWDPVNNRIRSWLFDSDGGFVSGIWTSRDGQWAVQSTATLADGVQGSYTSIYQPLEDGNFSWHKVNQIVDGQLLPNGDEIVIQRR